ncbi:MAG: 30S ribosomal protein S9 [Opitutales bacterium]|jgi:small subunit ribosomal protein S9|nr:30S ribosomal protein S9 [Opitutales bacterium]
MSAKANTQVFAATGRRKAAIARVRLTEGKGKIIINGKKAEDFCALESFHFEVNAPMKVIEREDQFNLAVNVQGGGYIGQAFAIRLGIARALEKYDEELRSPLKSAGFLRRDSRVRERKKSGQPGARKRFQFSKR